MLDIDYFRAIQNATGVQSENEAKIIEAQLRLDNDLKASINYKPDALCNGVRQGIILLPNTKAEYKSTIIAFPNDKLNVGDVLYVDGLYWIIVTTNVTNPIQTIGTGWLCNHLFRFQNYSSKILEYWGVVDDGSYALPQSGDEQIRYPNNRVNFYLPYNDDTKYLYIDKRIATDIVYDKNGNEILEVYVIEGKKQSLSTYGSGGHLLVLEAVSGQYNNEKDNLKEGICDYICKTESSTNKDKPITLLTCKINGRNTIRAGGTGTYSVSFGSEHITPVWSLKNENPNVALTIDHLTATLKVADVDEVVGEIITLCCRDSLNKYNTSEFEIEVI